MSIVIVGLTGDDKVPGRYGQTLYAQGKKSVGAQPMKCLITGNITAAGSMTEDVDTEQIFDVADADAKLGPGSEAALQAYAALKVPGVSVMELASSMRPSGDSRVVLISTISGRIGSEGVNTRMASSKLALISSLKKCTR